MQTYTMINLLKLSNLLSKYSSKTFRKMGSDFLSNTNIPLNMPKSKIIQPISFEARHAYGNSVWPWINRITSTHYYLLLLLRETL